MGVLKEKWIEDQEAGYSAKEGLVVCINHFKDPDILKYFTENGKIGSCSFCDEREIQTISFQELLKIIVTGIKYFYDDPDNGLSYDNEEGEYLGNIYSTEELLSEVIEFETDQEILDELTDSIVQDSWTEGEFYGDSYTDHLIYNWNTFENLVKYKVRYVFANIEEERTYDENYKPYKILNDIGSFINSLGLVKSFPRKTTLFNQTISFIRAQQHDTKREIKVATNIGSAPKEYAGANRFSAEGISIFYGAEDSETAIAEIINPDKPDELISTGEFMPAKPMNFVDLRNIETVGIFNIKNLALVEPSTFLKEFVRRISQKIENESNERIDYVPSQIVMEYFRYLLPNTVEKEVHGIVYESIQNPGKDCYAIFADNSQCVDEGKDLDESLLILKKGSITTQKVENYLK